MTFTRGSNREPAREALARFAEKCVFDPVTGCVLWTGGTSAGKGNTARYGRFWHEGFMWYAHRWAAVHIKRLDLGTDQAGHNCPLGPNTLCVEHVTGQTQLENLAELNGRLKARQTAEQRQYWLFVQLSIEPTPEGPKVDPDAIPFYAPPAWLAPFLKTEQTDECPF